MKNSPISVSKSGFTLLELLSTVAIVSVLAALLIPGTKAMIERGNQTRCASNMRQILHALRDYANDNNNKFPAVSEANNGTKRWTRGERLGSYLPERKTPEGTWENLVFVCPSATWGGRKGPTLRKTYAATSAMYGRSKSPTNNGNETLGTDNDMEREITTINKPSQTPLIVEGKLSSQSAGSSVSWSGAKADIDQGDPLKTAYISFHHNKKTNVGMVDGSVRVLTLKEFGETFNEKLWMGLD